MFYRFSVDITRMKLHFNFTNPYICCGSIFTLGLNFLFLFLGMVMHDDEFETKENNIKPKIKLSHNKYRKLPIISPRLKVLEAYKGTKKGVSKQAT